MEKTKSWLPYFIAVIFAWGSTFVFIKGCLEFLTPVGVAFTRYALGALFMVLYSARLRLKFPRNKQILARIFILSLFFNSLFGILLALAETEISSALAGIGASIVPLMTLFFVAVVFRSEKLTFEQIIGLIIGFIGALSIFGVWNGIGDNPWWAMLALLAATVCYGIAYPYSKKYILPYGLKTEVLVTTQLCFSAITLLPLFLLFGVKQAPQTLWQVSSAICVGFICSGIAFVWNLKVLEAAGSIIASSVMFLVPIVSIGLGVTFLNESITWNEPVGCAIVLFGAAVGQGRIQLGARRNS
ncbi:MAG: DMT family transporter [Actinobacteria bacterium]|nr:MAG: DMT family transporter [Actinomycetota bacterium]